MLVGRSIEFALIAYGLLIGIAMGVAAMIKLIYWVVHRSSKANSNEGKEA